jgi:hypothetical protein
VLNNGNFASASADNKIKVWELGLVSPNPQTNIAITTQSTTTELAFIEVTLQPPTYINIRK